MPHWSELMHLSFFFNYKLFPFNNEVHKLRPMRPTISQKEKEIQNVLIKRSQVDKNI